MRLEWERGLYPTLKELAKAHDLRDDTVRHISAKEGWQHPTKRARDVVARALEDLHQQDVNWATGQLKLKRSAVTLLIGMAIRAVQEAEKPVQAAKARLAVLQEQYRAAGTEEERSPLLGSMQECEAVIAKGNRFQPKDLADVLEMVKIGSMASGDELRLLESALRADSVEARQQAGTGGVNVMAGPGANVTVVNMTSVQQLIEAVGARNVTQIPAPGADSEPPSPSR